MKSNKYTVVLHTHNEEYYPYCTNVENDGAILCFTDVGGNFHKTSVPWTITKVTEKENPQ